MYILEQVDKLELCKIINYCTLQMQDTKTKDKMPVNSRMTPSIKFAGTHLCTWVETGNVRVKCLVEENMCQAQ